MNRLTSGAAHGDRLEARPGQSPMKSMPMRFGGWQHRAGVSGTIVLLLFLCVAGVSVAGEKTTVDGVLHVRNDATPSGGTETVALEEMWRVCRPGGVIVVWDHNPLNPYWPVVMSRVPQDTGAERLVPAEEIRAALAPLPGTEVQKVWHTGFVPDFAPRLLLPAFRVLERLVEGVPLLARYACAHNVLVARKADRIDSNR